MRPGRAGGARRGTTLVELSIVIALLGILALVVVPNGRAYAERAREATLRQQLTAMRDQIDKFRADQKRYPGSLQELVEKGYLRAVPTDPYTGTNASWKVEASEASEADVYEVRSGSDAKARDGRPVSEW